jgi:hypothetical protein
MTNLNYVDFFIKKVNKALIKMDLIIDYYGQGLECEGIMRPALFLADISSSSYKSVHKLTIRV